MPDEQTAVRIALAADGAQTLEHGLRAVCPAVEVRRVEPAALARAYTACCGMWTVSPPPAG